MTYESDTVFSIGGELNSSTVLILDENNRRLIKQSSKLIFDLSQVTSSDNTGVALLVVLTSFAKSQGKELSFINLPKQLQDLVRAVGVSDILPIVFKV
ncbi:MAG: STAS domain-containing protein [Coxiellaceae bacterium]|nr:STAS domain-containing protein [Coxiellaceae bacterium]